jgi:hypothetical protein
MQRDERGRERETEREREKRTGEKEEQFRQLIRAEV